jgi:hypothetical protein
LFFFFIHLQTSFFIFIHLKAFSFIFFKISTHTCCFDFFQFKNLSVFHFALVWFHVLWLQTRVQEPKRDSVPFFYVWVLAKSNLSNVNLISNASSLKATNWSFCVRSKSIPGF